MTDNGESEGGVAEDPEEGEPASPKKSAPHRSARVNSSSLRQRVCERCGNKKPDLVLGRFQRPEGQASPCEACGKPTLRGLMVAAGKTAEGAWETPKADGVRWNGSGPPKPTKPRRVTPTDDGKRLREAAAQKISIDVLSIRPLRPPGQSCVALPAPTLSTDRAPVAETASPPHEEPTPKVIEVAPPAPPVVVPTPTPPSDPEVDPEPVVVERESVLPIPVDVRIMTFLREHGPSATKDMYPLARSKKQIDSTLGYLKRAGRLTTDDDGRWVIQDEATMGARVKTSNKVAKKEQPAKAVEPRQRDVTEEMKASRRPVPVPKQPSTAQRLLAAMLERRRMTAADCVAVVSDRSISMVHVTLRDAEEAEIIRQDPKDEFVYEILDEDAALLVVEGKKTVQQIRLSDRAAPSHPVAARPWVPPAAPPLPPVRMAPRSPSFAAALHAESASGGFVNSLLSAAVERARVRRAVLDALHGVPKEEQYVVLAELIVSIGNGNAA